MVLKLSKIIAAPEINDESDFRAFRLLRIILLSLIVLNPITIIAFSLTLRPRAEIIAILILFTVLLIAFYIMRHGKIKLASFIVSFALWLMFTFAIIVLGGYRSPGILGYFLVILIAGLLLGGKFSGLFSVLSIATGLILWAVEAKGYLPDATTPITPTYIWSTAFLGIILMVVLLQLFTQSLNDALNAAKSNAEALAKKNTELQIVQVDLRNHVEDLRVTEAALRQSEERLRTVVDSAPIILWGIDSNGEYTLAQGKALSQFGFHSVDLVGRSIFQYETNIPNLRHYVQQALIGKTVTSTETLRERVLEIRFSPLIDDNQIVGVTGVALDITERVQTEEALRQAQKLESLGLLAGGIAHDFNNLLVAMMSQNSLALRLMGEEHRAAKHVEKALRASARAADLTRQMLAFAGKNKYVMTPVSLNMLLVDNLEFLRASIPKNVELRPQMMETLPLIMGDEGQLQQVVMNLIINGADAIGQVPGQVVVTTSVCDVEEGKWGDGWLRANLELQGGRYAVVEVADTGVGMSAETLARIFDPFFTTKEKGRGLGLAAVSGIVRAHQGDLWVRSILGQGTTFQLLLPILQEGGEVVDVEPPTAVSSTTASTNHQHPSRVLIIDDEEPVLEAVTDILALSGVEALTAVSGQQGIDLYKQHSKDIAVILLDLSMPEMTGEDTFYLLRQINPNVPVILSSGYDEKEAKKRIADAGQADFLAKPYDVDILSAKLRGYVAG
ncbi:MAG: response regulator [Ardenticatenaceae bacterium]|nr:response regulator [Ardenticatenaceae bacterium]